MWSRPILWVVCLGLAACSSLPTPQARKAKADDLAAAHGWQAFPLRTERFDLLAYAPTPIRPIETLTIYIEGDGLAWIDHATPSDDPTPLEPLGLKLALAQASGMAVYIGRPCQYVGATSHSCTPAYWMQRRFAPEIIDAMDRAVTTMQQRWGARRLVLVGYSGGAAVAAMVAARRTDVTRLITVAGNLDHRAWTTYHRVSPLDESLNAADMVAAIARVRQVHFVGARDAVVPPTLAFLWPPGIQGSQGANVRVIDGFDHRCCWAEHWPSLMPRDRD